MKIYLAGAYTSRQRLAAIAQELRTNGTRIQVDTVWLLDEYENANPFECAAVDLRDIKSADMLLLFTDTNGTRGGMYVELGIALAKGIPVIIVGPYTNVFTRICRRVDSISELFNEFTRT
jgi:nucleoside 2-deoxyribosyltransferase